MSLYLSIQKNVQMKAGTEEYVESNIMFVLHIVY